MAGTVEQKLAAQGITLPEPRAAMANYVGFVRSGNLLFVSGQVCDNPDGKLKANMFAAVRLSADMASAGALSVPESAILDTGKRQTVLVERGEGRYEPREVKVGRRADGYAEILEGVAKDEKVVVSANFLIDAESNLQSALRAFTASGQPAAEPETQP